MSSGGHALAVEPGGARGRPAHLAGNDLLLRARDARARARHGAGRRDRRRRALFLPAVRGGRHAAPAKPHRVRARDARHARSDSRRDGLPQRLRTALRRRGALYAAALMVFAAATIIFGVSMLPFRDPIYLGHQLRELVTHTLVTLPLALGTCFVLARRYSRREPDVRSSMPAWTIYAAGIVAVVCGAYVLVAALVLKAQAYGQKKALAGLLYLWPLRNRRSSQQAT